MTYPELLQETHHDVKKDELSLNETSVVDILT
jgi:hypothetical protein